MPTMYDSATPNDIPTDAQIVAGYIDGNWPWPATGWKRFPNAQQVTITVTGLAGARVCDTEKGNITPAGTAAWARGEIYAGRRPTVYCSLAVHPTVLHYLVQMGIGTEQVDWWIADWRTTSTTIPSWAVARQWASPTYNPQPGQGHYDISVTNGVWPAAANPTNPLEPATPPGTTPVPAGPHVAPGLTLRSLTRTVAGTYGGLGGPIVSVHAAPSGKGYTFAGSDGGTFAFGDAPFDGSIAGSVLAAPVVDSTMSPTHKGIWLAGADGGVFALGAAKYFGGMAGHKMNAPITGIAVRPQLDGYWLVGTDGGIFNFGAAGFFGSMGGKPLNKPITGIAATPSGNGYWLVGADGGIFAYGDAHYYGSITGTKITLAKPVVSMTATKSGGGYWLVSTDGGVFAFGDAPFHGSLPGYASNTYPITTQYPIAGIAPTPTEGGYWMVSISGALLGFGNANFRGAVSWGVPMPITFSKEPNPIPPTPGPANSSAAAGAVAYALSKLGHPYSETVHVRLGPTYYDCSGLVYMAYQSVGVTIGTWTGVQWPVGSGERVPTGVQNLLPGDLVFFGTTGVNGPAAHVAMVVSVNVGADSVHIVEAADPQLGVIVDTFIPTVGAQYGPQVYLGATRPAPA